MNQKMLLLVTVCRQNPLNDATSFILPCYRAANRHSVMSDSRIWGQRDMKENKYLFISGRCLIITKHKGCAKISKLVLWDTINLLCIYRIEIYTHTQKRQWGSERSWSAEIKHISWKRWPLFVSFHSLLLCKVKMWKVKMQTHQGKKWRQPKTRRNYGSRPFNRDVTKPVIRTHNLTFLKAG